jgi:hypothetical protein
LLRRRWDLKIVVMARSCCASKKRTVSQLTTTQALGGLPESLDAVIQRFDSGPERFNDPAELRRVQSFLSSVEEIGKLTGLVFDEAVKNGDMAKGRDLRDLRESVGDTDTLRDFLRTGGRLNGRNGRVSPLRAAAASNPPATKRSARKGGPKRRARPKKV